MCKENNINLEVVETILDLYGETATIATDEELAYSLPEAIVAINLIVLGRATEYTDPREHCLEED